MEQEIEKAAMDYAETNVWWPGETSYECDCLAMTKSFADAFTAGAEWQRKRSPWININERLPKNKDKILVLSRMNTSGNYFVYEDSYDDKEWAVSSAAHYIRVAWMPIPSFDEILEANKDVLERIKKKGG